MNARCEDMAPKKEAKLAKFTVKRCHRNLTILSIGMLCNMSSYRTLEAFQSSLNKGVGASSLVVIYATSLICSILLPPYLIMQLKCKKCLILAPIAYAVYTTANFYPTTYTLLPASFLLGLGNSLLWPSSFVYIIHLSKIQASLTGEGVVSINGRYFGIFWGVGSISGILGMLFLVVLFQALNQEVVLNFDKSKINSTSTESFKTTSVSIATGTSYVNATTCGLYRNIDEAPSTPKATLSNVVLYSMYSGFLLLNVVTSTLYAFLDEVDDVSQKTNVLQPNQLNPHSSEDKAQQKSHQTQKEAAYQIEDVELLERDNEDQNQIRETCSYVIKKQDSRTNMTTMSGLKTIKVVGHLLIKNKCGLLLAILSIAVGMVQAVVRGPFLTAWVNCTNGVEFAVYVMICFGIFVSLGSISSGFLLRRINFIPLFFIALVLIVSFLAVLLIIKTDIDVSVSYFFLAGAVAFGTGIFNGQLPNVYNEVFPDEKSAAVTLNTLWLNGGAAILYLVTVVAWPIASIVTLLVFLTLGFMTFSIAFKIKDTTWKEWKCKKVSRNTQVP